MNKASYRTYARCCPKPTGLVLQVDLTWQLITGETNFVSIVAVVLLSWRMQWVVEGENAPDMSKSCVMSRVDRKAHSTYLVVQFIYKLQALRSFVVYLIFLSFLNFLCACLYKLFELNTFRLISKAWFAISIRKDGEKKKIHIRRSVHSFLDCISINISISSC